MNSAGSKVTPTSLILMELLSYQQPHLGEEMMIGVFILTTPLLAILIVLAIWQIIDEERFEQWSTKTPKSMLDEMIKSERL